MAGKQGKVDIKKVEFRGQNLNMRGGRGGEGREGRFSEPRDAKARKAPAKMITRVHSERFSGCFVCSISFTGGRMMGKRTGLVLANVPGVL